MIETNRIDRNLQILNGVERTWGLPGLPDGVKLDLASMNGVDHQTLGSFTSGLAGDVQESIAPKPQPLVTASALPGVTTPIQPDYSVRDQFDRAWAGLSGAPAPERIASDGVIQFKERAKSMGYLDKAAPDDGSWSPELNTVRWRMIQDDYDRRASGNKPGAVSMGGISKFIGDWLAPTGLLKAATTLDLLPDFGAVAEQSKGFLHAASDFVKDASLHNFKQLFVENPLDDLLLPVINDALLFTGVGEVWAFARAGTLAAEGFELATAANGLLGTTKMANVGRFIRSADFVADAERFKEASMLSRLAGRTGTYGEKVADAMAHWRELEGVATTKKAVQAGMRLGLAQRLEGLLPGEQTGIGLNDVPGGRTIHDYVDRVVTNPLVSTIGEVMFTPPTLLEPGSLMRIAGAAKTGLVSGAEAVGPHLPGRLKFVPVAQDELLGTTFAQGYRAHLGTTAPEKLAQFEEDVKAKGLAKSLATHMLGGDTDEHLDDLGRAMTYVATAASMDAMAAAKADGVANRFADPERWNKTWATFRNKYIAQLRQWDPENVDQMLTHKAAILAADEGGSAPGKYKRLLAQIEKDPAVLERLKAEVGSHNEWSTGFYKELLDNAAKPEVLQAYLPQVLDTFGNWSEFATAQAAIKDALESGLLDEARYLAPTSERGRRLVAVKGEMAAAKATPSGIGMHHRLFEEEDYIPWMTSGMYSPLARGIDPSIGAYTVARAETVSKGEQLRFVQAIRGRQKLLKDVRAAERLGLASEVFPRLAEAAKDAGLAGIHQLPNDVVKGIASEIEAASKGDNVDRLTRLLGWMRHGEYGDLGAMRAGLESDLSEMANSPLWAERFGINNIVTKRDGIRPMTMDDKLKALIKKSKWTAAEVEVPDGLDLPDGYKLVHGVQYLLPSDLLWTNPVADLTESHVRRVTLGNWFTRQNNKQFGQHIGRVQRMNLQERLSKLDPTKLEGLDVAALDSPDLDTVMSSVRNILRKKQDMATEVLEGTGTGRIAKATLSANTPISVSDLGHSYHRNMLLKELTKIGYTREVAEATWQALKDSQTYGARRRGLVAIEDHIRNQPYLLNALHALGNSGAGDSLASKLTKLAPTAAGAFVGSEVGSEATGGETYGRLGGALAGGIAGAAATPTIARGAAAAAGKLEHSDWLRYAYLGDELAHVRDTLRFALNPFFDVRRFVKSTILAHTADLPADIKLAAIPTKRAFIKQYGEDTYGRYVGELRAAMRGNFNPDSLEDTQAFFSQRGLLGYDPTSWMASMYGQLREAGVANEKAADTVRKVYAYGSQGRSAAELSANFIFFPFSFEKKVVLHLSKYLAKDLSRSVMIHDAMKTYDTLDREYDLHTKLRKYVPLVHQLERLNPLDHGLSLGELGGINAPLIKLFMPQVFGIHDSDHAAALQKYAQRLLPFFGEVRGMMDDLGQQGHVMFSPAHMSREAETDAGFEAAHKLRDQWAGALEGQGSSWRAMLSDPDLGPMKAAYDEQLAGIMAKFPEYRAARADLAKRAIENADEIKVRLSDPEHAALPENQALAQYVQLDDLMDTLMRNNFGLSFTDDADQVPPEVYDAMRADALRFVKATPDFLPLYKRFFARKYGPITKELV